MFGQLSGVCCRKKGDTKNSFFFSQLDGRTNKVFTHSFERLPGGNKGKYVRYIRETTYEDIIENTFVKIKENLFVEVIENIYVRGN